MKPLSDLTRWNRAGLTRFRYVDGNAAVWLEELRIGMLAQYLRGIPAKERLPEKWRELFLKKESDWELTLSQAQFEQAVAWAALLPSPPPSPETGGARNRRLVEQYGRRSSDYAWELTQAFARAAHILLEHLDAYANEGYLPTATQWDSLRMLAAAVNYLPTPPASAIATVALHVAEGAGAIEIAAGLAMKYARPEGGAPLIFETLKPVVGHADLNAVRTVGWDRNKITINISVATDWIVPAKARLAPGDLAVLAGPGSAGSALSLASVERDEHAAVAKIAFDPPAGAGPPLFEAGLHIEPDGVRLGLPESNSSQTVVNVAGAASIPAGSVVEIRYKDNEVAKSARAIVTESGGAQLILSGLPAISGAVEVEAYTPIGADGAGDFATMAAVSTLYFKHTDGTVAAQGDGVPHEDNGEVISRKFARPPETTGIAYANFGGNRTFNGAIVSAAPSNIGSAGAMVRFEGKPPKALEAGDWYVARPVGSMQHKALKVDGVRVEATFYYVIFNAVVKDPEHTEFLGPMTRRLQPVDHDRSRAPAIVGGVALLGGLSPAARELVKPGRTALVVFDPAGGKREAAQAVIGNVEPVGDDLRLTLVSETGFLNWAEGWTTFHLNTVGVSHGETMAPKMLGSGDAAKTRQAFHFKVDTVSFVPSSAAVSGVAPDMDVAVDGVKWEYRDLGDPLAEGLDAWSVRLNQDSTLQIHFRRRLPTGRNNVAVPRHRVGVGLSGTDLPPWSFTEPMKKNRFVTAITQPFATAGGSEREPVSAMRENAPANLAANGRAVSLRDFERLCKRHSSVWQAHAREVLGVTVANLVDVVIVPSGGGAVTAALKDDLLRFTRARALPGVAITISPYEAVLVKIAVTARVDTGRFEKADVQDAVLAALADWFSLARRKLGQPIYVAEILAAAERVEGVETVVVNAFERKPGAPEPLREAPMSGGLAAIFPRVDQVVHVAGAADIVAVMEAM